MLGSILASSSAFLTYAMLLVVRTHPWWNAQYFIPMLGMLLGNCISGISVGLTTLLEELTSGAQPIRIASATPVSSVCCRDMAVGVRCVECADRSCVVIRQH